MTPVLGIDFGTTNTVAAWLDERGELHVVRMGEATDEMPTVVSYMPGESILVGESAKGRLLDAPTETVYGVKRFLGRRFLSEFVGRNQGQFSYEICEGDSGLAAVFVHGKVRALEDVAFAVLDRVVELANIASPVPFEECVLSVPAHFSYRQRSLLRKAAERLLNVKAMINEPTAAALSFAMNAPEDAMVMVYDLGGGTLDVTVLRIHENTVGVMATGGESFLGGLDFDNEIALLLAERIRQKHQVDIMDDPVVALRVRQAAEKAKIALSTESEFRVRVPVVFTDGERFIDMDEVLRRQEIEGAVAKLIERSIGLAEETTKKAGISPDLLHGVVLVGGQTRMPAVRRRLEQVFPAVKSAESVDAVRAVAQGAALLGAGASRLVDVLSLPIGVMAPGLSGGTALPQNARLPTANVIELPMRPAAGTPLKIALYESVDVTSIDREMLGVLEVPGDWLDENPGGLKLHAAMSAGFELSAEVEATEGGRLPLYLHGPGQKALRPGTANTGDPSRMRQSGRAPAQVTLHFRRHGASEFVDAVATDVSAQGLFIETPYSYPVGTKLDVELDVGGWGGARAEVTRLGVGANGQRGIGVKFLTISPTAQRALAAMVVQDQAQDQEELDFDIETVEQTPQLSVAERLRLFLKAVAAQRMYEAIGIDDPLAPADKVQRAVQDLEDLVATAMVGASPPVRERLKRAQAVGVKLKRLFLNPRARLHYDFRCGHVRAEERLRLAAQKKGPDVQMLREAWHHVFPDRVDRAALHQAKAMQAAHQGSWALALMEAEKAIGLEPFSMTLRLARKEWSQKATTSLA